MQAAPPADVCSGPGEGAPCSPLCHAGGVESGPETPQRFWVLGPSIWAPHPAWVLQCPCPSRSLCAELLLDFLPHLAEVRKLQRAGVSCLSWLQADPGDPRTLACHWLCHLPSPTSHPVCWGRTYFRSRNGTRKEQKECVGSRTLHSGAHPGRGCSGSSSGAQLSFPAGIFPLWEHLGGPSLPHRLRTPCAWAPWGRDTALALQMTPLFFSLKVHYQTAASYGGAGLSLLHYGTAQPSFTTPGPVTSPSRLHPCHGRLWGHVLSPPLPVGAAPCQGQAARLLRVSISA